jgi:hypothetical protein
MQYGGGMLGFVDLFPIAADDTVAAATGKDQDREKVHTLRS